MLGRFASKFFRIVSRPRTLLTVSTFLGYSYLKNMINLDTIPNNQSTLQQQQQYKTKIKQYLQQLRSVFVCQDKQILEGQRKVVTVKDYSQQQRKIIVLRLRGKLYAFSGTCSHTQPFDNGNQDYSLDKAIIFNDKLYCPHHGCIFDIKSGSVQHGPALQNLPIFMAQQKLNKINVIYPLAMPKAVDPYLIQRDVEDKRKAMILGGDDSATIGCINSLRQFGYSGQINVVIQGNYEYPYKKQYLHKKFVNLHLDDKKISEIQKLQAQQLKKTNNQKQKQQIQTKNAQLSSNQLLIKYIQNEMQNKIYKKLKYYKDQWYQKFGIQFIVNSQSYRIINKQYYPFVTFIDGSKLQFDGLLVATGSLQKLPRFQGITLNNERDFKFNLAQNVFCPYRSKSQHLKLNKFLNLNSIKSLLVYGYNTQSLQFVNAIKQQFPQIKITVIDSQNFSQISQLFGPQIQKKIAKQYTQRGVQIYIKIKDQLLFSNRYSYKNIQKQKQIVNKDVSSWFKAKNIVKKADKQKYLNSITVRLSDQLRINADGIVIISNQHIANTEWVKNGKYTDFEYAKQSYLVGDTFMRTDNIRIFSAGLCSANDYYLGKRKFMTNDPNFAYQQGYNAGINMQAIKIPFTYIPYRVFSFFNKKIIYVGRKEFFDSVMVIGSVEDWDFFTVYSSGNQITAVSGTPSKYKQLCIFRQAFRTNVVPSFQDMVSGYWTIPNLAKLIRTQDKSGCYRDIIFQNKQNIDIKCLIWMERNDDAGFQNDRPQMSEQLPNVEVGQDGKLSQL